MKTKILIIFLAGFVLTAYSQDSINLFDCYQKAVDNYPLLKQKNLLIASHDLTQENLKNDWYPSIQLNGQVHYQTDVTKVPFPDIPGITVDELSKDWYKFTLETNQLIYDGGMTKSLKEIEILKNQVELQELDVELYKLKDRVNLLFFSILIYKEKLKILELQQEVLEARLKEVKSGVINGVLLKSNEDLISAEILKVDQSYTENVIDMESRISMLNELTGLQIHNNSLFDIPFMYQVNLTYTNNRPEIQLFDMQQQQLEANKKLMGGNLLPRLFGFGQAGLGRPGYDMLKNEFDDFYMVGAKISWKFWDWNETKKKKEQMDLNAQILEASKETFDKNLRISCESQKAEISKMEEAVHNDAAIIDLRKNITKSYEWKYTHGEHIYDKMPGINIPDFTFINLLPYEKCKKLRIDPCIFKHFNYP